MVPTWAISLRSLVGLDRLLSSATMASTARSIPRLSDIGSWPAATILTPSLKIERARTVAVVVPSPATSEVLEATSLTICAPMFSNLSSSSISLATVTPSLVTVGAPKLFSSTTLRPLGPKRHRHGVGQNIDPLLDFLPRILRKANNFGRHSCYFLQIQKFRIVRAGSASSTPRMSSSRRIRCSSPSSFTSLPEYLPNRIDRPSSLLAR